MGYRRRIRCSHLFITSRHDKLKAYKSCYMHMKMVVSFIFVLNYLLIVWLDFLGVNQQLVQPQQDTSTSLGQNSLFNGSIPPGFNGITGNGLIGVKGTVPGVNVPPSNTAGPTTANLANDFSKITLDSMLFPSNRKW